jgi:hypothetical protein
MTSWHVLVAHAVKILVLLTLAGIVARHRARLCWSLVAYLSSILVSNTLISLWPDTFFVASFYLLKQALYDCLRLAIAVELTYRTFQAFSGAESTARRVVFALLALTSIALIGVPSGLSGGGPALYAAAFKEWEPRVMTGTIWLMNGLAVLVIWYRVPIHAYHKAILLGFVPYLLIFTTLLRLLQIYGWDVLPLIQSAEPAAFLLLMAWWAYAAWQPEAAPDVSPAVLRALQPWRARA